MKSVPEWIFEQLPDAVAVCGPAASGTPSSAPITVMYSNRALRQLLRSLDVPAGDVAWSDLLQAFSPQWPADLEDIHEEAARADSHLELRRFAQRLGSWYDIHIYGRQSGEFAAVFRQVEDDPAANQGCSRIAEPTVLESCYDVNIRLVYVNDTAVHQLGMPASELLGRTPAEMPGPPSLQEGLQQLLTQVRDSGVEQVLHHPMVLLSGLTEMETRITPVRDTAGVVVSLLVVTSPMLENGAEPNAFMDEQLLDIMKETPAVMYSYVVANGQPQLNFVDSNIHRILGLDPEPMLRDIQKWQERVHPEDLPQLANKLSGQDSFDEYRFQDVYGQYHWLHDRQRATVINESTVQVVGVWWDITELKQAEAQLHQLVSQQRLLLDHIEVQIWYLTDAEHYGMVNAAHAAFFGVSKEDLEYRSLWDILDPAEVELCVQGNQAVIAGGRTMRCEEWIINGEGQQRLLAITKTPHTKDDGTVDFIVCSAVDITEERELRRQVVQREEELRTVFEAADNVAFVTTELSETDPAILAFSPGAEKIFGYAKEEVIGQSVNLLHDASDIAQFPDIVTSCLKKRQPYTGEMNLYRKNGERFPVLITIHPLFDEQGEVYATLGVSIDITERKHSEQQLRHREEVLRGILESQRDLIVRVDLANKFTYVNNAYCEAFGKSQEELLGHSFTPLVHQDDLEATLAAMEGLFRPPYRCYVEQRAMTVHGWRWLAWEDSAIRNEAGEVVEITGIGRDITAYKDALAEQKASEERFRAVVQDQTELICRFDPEGTLTFVNDAYCQFFQKSSAELVGNTFLPLIPDEDQQLVQYYQDLLTPDSPVVVYEHRVLMPDGETRWQQWIDRAFYNEDGSVLEYQAVGRDITEQKRTEEELRRAREELELRVQERTRELRVTNDRLLAEVAEHQRTSHMLAEEKQLLSVTLASIADGVIAVDANGRIFYVNPSAEQITGCQGADHQGQALSSMMRIPRDEAETSYCADALAQILAGSDNGLAGEYVLFSADGQRRIIATTTAPIGADSGGSMGYVVAFRDVTEQKRIEMQLALAQKLDSVGKLTAGIAHEINTPMQYIGDNAHFLESAFDTLLPLLPGSHRTVNDPAAGPGKPHAASADGGRRIQFYIDEIPQAIDALLDGVGRVSRLIQAMKDFTHPGSQGRTYADINAAIEGVVTMSRNEWKYHADVVTELDPDLPEVYCSVDELSQVVLNMVLNAVDAVADAIAQDMIQRGEIRIRTSLRGETVRIEVEDNGTGIPPEIQDKLFDPFFTTKDVGKGTGQGLSIAYDIVTSKHDGTIAVQSQPGRTVFVMELPLAAPTAEENQPLHDGAAD